jgi:hypothetical protein
MAAQRHNRRPDRATPGTGRPADRKPAAGGRPESARAGGRLERAAVAAGRAVRVAGRRLLAAAWGETGRRVGRAAALTVVVAVLVTTLYDRGEAPAAAARPAVGGPAAAAPRRDAAAPEDRGGLRGRPRPARAGERAARPAEVAAAWYAANHGLPRARVRALQQDRLSAREVRVLVLADAGAGRLRTAMVRVRLTASGWSVR